MPLNFPHKFRSFPSSHLTEHQQRSQRKLDNFSSAGDREKSSTNNLRLLKLLPAALESSRSYYENYEPPKNFFHLFIIGAERRLLSPPSRSASSRRLICLNLCVIMRVYLVSSDMLWETKWNGSRATKVEIESRRDLRRRRFCLLLKNSREFSVWCLLFPTTPTDSTFDALICRTHGK